MRRELEQAVDLLRERRPESVEQALALLQDTVFSFSMKVCGHREDAEDTMQETLLRAAPQLPSFDNPQALAVWLYKVARSRCLMSRRRSKFAPRQHLSLDQLLPDRNELQMLAAQPRSGPEQQLLASESREQLQKAVEAIPPDYRMILVLHDMEELSNAEIAAITGLREGTVRVRLHRARVFLRNQLTRGTTGKTRSRKKAAPSKRCRKLFSALSDYLDRVGDPTALEAIEAHLADCKPCAVFLDSLRATVERCRRHCPAEERVHLGKQLREALLRSCGRA